MSQTTDLTDKIAAVLRSHCPAAYMAVAQALLEIERQDRRNEEIIVALAIRPQYVVGLNIAPGDKMEMHG